MSKARFLFVMNLTAVCRSAKLNCRYRPFPTNITRSISSIDDDISHYGKKKQNAVSLKALIETGVGARIGEFFGTSAIGSNSSKSSPPTFSQASDRVKIQIACFLHRELPIRFAHRALELEKQPEFQGNKHIMTIASWYRRSFAIIRECPAPVDIAKEEAFSKCIKDIYERHSHTLIVMARGAHELRQTLGKNIGEFARLSDVQNILDAFYLSRISIRMLIGQYLAIRDPSAKDDDMIGLISQKVNIKNVSQQAVEDARYMCIRKFGEAPEVTIHGRTDLTFAYVPSHIQYILLELLKNSLRATVETHQDSGKLPAVRIIVADGEDNEDVIIKVSDEGGGIRRSNLPLIWSYLFTTADPAILNNMLSDDADFTTSAPLAGLGYGIPISRNYARFFGGDLVIMSMENYGTDCYIYLPKLKETVLMQA